MFFLIFNPESIIFTEPQIDRIDKNEKNHSCKNIYGE